MHPILCKSVNGATCSKAHGKSNHNHLNNVKVSLVAWIVSQSHGDGFYEAKTNMKREHSKDNAVAEILRVKSHCMLGKNAPSMSSLTHPVALRAITVAKAIAPANRTNPFLQHYGNSKSPKILARTRTSLRCRRYLATLPHLLQTSFCSKK